MQIATWTEKSSQDGSALLIQVPAATGIPFTQDPLWLIPLPAGEPRRVGNLDVVNAEMFPDGRIVFAKFVPGTDAKEPDMRADWFIVEKDGSSQHKLVSLSGDVGWVSSSAGRSAHSPHSAAPG